MYLSLTFLFRFPPRIFITKTLLSYEAVEGSSQLQSGDGWGNGRMSVLSERQLPAMFSSAVIGSVGRRGLPFGLDQGSAREWRSRHTSRCLQCRLP